MLRHLYPVVLLLALLAVPSRATRADDPPEAATPAPVADALADLQAPGERTREEAVERLIQDLPASLDAVLTALPTAPTPVKVHLIEVLAADASLPAIRALLAEMQRGGEILAVRIRRVLLRDERATRRILEAWAVDPDLMEDASGQVTERTRTLERLLRRAEAERLFITRKSRTGSTGSYRGQYKVLEPYREEALEICLALITDRALPEPGIYAAGSFSFLRPSPIHIDIGELRGMAAHAFSELARAGDSRHLFALHSYLTQLRAEVEEHSLGFDDPARFADALSRYADLLVALYLVRPDRYKTLVDTMLRQLQYDAEWRYALGSTYRALVLLRIGRHAEAVYEFERAMRFPSGLQSEAATHYNLACAYAQWAEHTEEGLERASRIATALDHLEASVDNRWSDVGWMEQDRDLEPLRKHVRYGALVERVRRELDLDD